MNPTMIRAPDLSDQLSAVMKVKGRHPIQVNLETLGWSGAELARRLGVHANSITWWVSRKGKVPKYATAYLDLALSIKALSGKVESLPRKRRKAK